MPNKVFFGKMQKEKKNAQLLANSFRSSTIDVNPTYWLPGTSIKNRPIFGKNRPNIQFLKANFVVSILLSNIAQISPKLAKWRATAILKKWAPRAIKYRPNGGLAPNLASLATDALKIKMEAFLTSVLPFFPNSLMPNFWPKKGPNFWVCLINSKIFNAKK